MYNSKFIYFAYILCITIIYLWVLRSLLLVDFFCFDMFLAFIFGFSALLVSFNLLNNERRCLEGCFGKVKGFVPLDFDNAFNSGKYQDFFFHFDYMPSEWHLCSYSSKNVFLKKEKIMFDHVFAIKNKRARKLSLWKWKIASYIDINI